MNIPTAIVERFWQRVAISGANDCWLWMHRLNPKGYGHFTAHGHPSSTAHRWAWKITHGEPNAGMDVAHSCHNRRCVNPAHLSLKTRSENMLDSANSNRLPCQRNPEKTNLRKLNREQVLEIRRLREAGIPPYALAAQFNVTADNIYCIINRKTWKHL